MAKEHQSGGGCFAGLILLAITWFFAGYLAGNEKARNKLAEKAKDAADRARQKYSELKARRQLKKVAAGCKVEDCANTIDVGLEKAETETVEPEIPEAREKNDPDK